MNGLFWRVFPPVWPHEANVPVYRKLARKRFLGRSQLFSALKPPKTECPSGRELLFGLIQKVTQKIKADGSFERKLRIGNATRPNSSFLLKQGRLPVPTEIPFPCFLIQNPRRPIPKRLSLLFGRFQY